MKDKEYSKLMDALELINAENVLIMRSLALFGSDEAGYKEIEKLTDEWIRKFDDIRRKW